ncbi:hypothetical protein STTU_4288 [Streptomyces sp. Tu6071]|nr:hypothetical protein STTU_4288 [Streptomyces sp. Tu6071]
MANPSRTRAGPPSSPPHPPLRPPRETASAGQLRTLEESLRRTRNLEDA